MLASEALRLPDVHDFEPVDDPGDPCPGCLNETVEEGICSVCNAEFCEECGKVEVSGSAKCEACAPVYTVTVAHCAVYQTRSLRRAWEAQRYIEEWSPYYGSMLINYERSDLDSDGITDREQGLIDSWDQYGEGRCLPLFTCIAPGGVSRG